MKKSVSGLRISLLYVLGILLSGFSGMAAALCEPGTTGYCVGPPAAGQQRQWPWADTNFNDQQDATDERIQFNRTSPPGALPPGYEGVWTIDSAWNCSGLNNQVRGDLQTFPRFRRFERVGSSGQFSQVTVSAAIGGFERITQMTVGEFGQTGTLDLLDTQPNGLYDLVRLTLVGLPAVESNLVGIDTDADGIFDHVSFPWGAVMGNGLISHSQGCCSPTGGQVPQVWIPLTDTPTAVAGVDGVPDSIVMDLDGSGLHDAEYYLSPPLEMIGTPDVNFVNSFWPCGAGVNIPTLGEAGLILLILMLAVVSWRSLRRNGGDGHPA